MRQNFPTGRKLSTGCPFAAPGPRLDDRHRPSEDDVMMLFAYLGLGLMSAMSTTASPPSTARSLPSATKPAMPSAVIASFRSQSWGATRHYWTVDGRGTVVWEQPQDKDFIAAQRANKPVRMQVKRFRLDARRFAALRTAIAKVRGSASMSDECDEYVPDGPYGQFGWTVSGHDEVMRVNGSCLRGPQGTKAALAFAADAIVRSAADKATVTDRRQL
jgi:hypothetical protein